MDATHLLVPGHAAAAAAAAVDVAETCVRWRVVVVDLHSNDGW